MQDPAVDAGRRAARYWTIDGLPELDTGFVWLCVPLYFYGVTHLPKSSPWHAVLVIGGTLALMFAIMGGAWVLGILKRRVTYPRTGYVAYQKPKAKAFWFPFLIAPLLMMLPFGPTQLVLPVTGLISAIILIAVAHNQRLNRLYFLGAFLLVVGIALGVAQVDVETGFSLFFGLAGMFAIVSGAFTLRRYLERPRA